MTLSAEKSAYINEAKEINIIVWSFGIIKLIIHLFCLEGYGLHADELYYIELGRNFSWGFVDISPFVTWVAGISESLLGTSTSSFRIVPCFFSAGTVVLTGYITQLLGGRRLAIIIACSAIICSPAFLATSYLLQPAVFDQFFWTLLCYSILAYKTSSKLIYLYLGAIALGLGMLNKFSILLIAGSFGLASMLIRAKSMQLIQKKFAGPFSLFLLLIMPNVVWQWVHNFPVFSYTLIVGQGAFNLEVRDYVLQVFLFHGAGVAVWSAGLFHLALDRKHEQSGIIWSVSLIVTLIFLAPLKGKLYYGLGAFPIFFAAGGVYWSLILEKVTSTSRVVFISTLYIFAVLSLPMVIPFLPLNLCRTYIKEMVKITGFSRPLKYENGTSGEIPQFFADMSDWKLLNRKTEHAAESYHLSSQPFMTVLTDNYGVAGALKYYGRNGSFKVISAHNSLLMTSPKTLYMREVIYLTKEKSAEIMDIAASVKLVDSLKTENSHLSGIYIYLLTSPTPHFKEKYLRDRARFYPELRSTGLGNRILFTFKNFLEYLSKNFQFL